MSAAVYSAAIDLGATSGRVMLGVWKDERLTLSEVHRFSNAVRTLGAHQYWEVGTLWHEVQNGLEKAAHALPRQARLASVGVDTWGVDHVLVNQAGRLVFPVHAYRDERTQHGLERLANAPGALERIYAATGIPNLFYNTSLQLAELIECCPGIVERAKRCLFLPDYFNFLLSGRIENELTVASTSQFLDVHSTEWSRIALDHFRIPSHWFTQPILAGTKLGPVKSSRRLGSTLVVAVPGHDTACAYDAMPASDDEADLYISSGTWSLVGFKSDTPVLGPAALAAGICNERIGDGRYRPLTSVLGLWLIEQILKSFRGARRTNDSWEALCAVAGALPRPPVLIDVSDPELVNSRSVRLAIDAQLQKHGARPPEDLAGYARLIYESLGEAHAAAMRALRAASGRTFRRILMVGGGSKNRLLCQATADASGLPVISFALEGSAVGNLANQLVALGAIESLAAFRRSFSAQLKRTVYEPSLDGAERSSRHARTSMPSGTEAQSD